MRPPEEGRMRMREAGLEPVEFFLFAHFEGLSN
jgi:hypothetical protein